MQSAFNYIQEQIRLLNWDKSPQGLYEPIGYALSAGGKRIRPALAVIASDLYDGSREEVLPAALALEVFHNFTLLHDDVMDHAQIRRGKPCVHVKWDTNTAILSGDEMLIEAYRLLSRVREDKLPKVLQLFNKMATEICEGQQYDVDYEHLTEVTRDDYLNMIRLKTSVLLGTALQIGSYIAGATDAEQNALYDYGVNIGLAFQLQDDILDVYGNPETFGKAIGGDILEGKKTYMLLTALLQADDAEKKELQQLLATTPTNDAEKQAKIAAVTRLYDKLQVREEAENAMQRFTQIALDDLQKISVSAERKLILINLAKQLLARKE